MECPKGSICKESSHEVTTMDKAIEWCPHVEGHHLPIKVYSSVSSDGRMYARIYSVKGNILRVKG